MSHSPYKFMRNTSPRQAIALSGTLEREIVMTATSTRFAGLVVLTLAGFALAGPITNNAVSSRAALGVGGLFQTLDLSALNYLTGSLTTSNSYSQTFTGPGGNYSGRLTVEVFGNVATPGPGLSDLLLIYTFTGDGAPVTRVNGAESFEFGVDTSVEVDFAALTAATHGRINSESSLQFGQLDPAVDLNDFVSGNDTWKFDYNPAGGSGRLVELGGNTASAPGATETYTWYVRSTGDVALNFVDVRITDFGAVTIKSLALVNNPNQPDLTVPGPGAAALMGLAGLVGLRRRR